METKTVKLHENEAYITLQSVLKFLDLVPSGGGVKVFLLENEVFVNQERENRRGRKLYPGDVIQVLGTEIHILEHGN